MSSLNIRGNITLNTPPPNGDGDVVLARDATTGAVGQNTTVLSASLTAGQLIVGNASNQATPTTITGDVTINSSGVTAISSGVIVNADINASAAIAVNKLATITASRAIVSDASGFLSASSVTSTEVGHLSGVTSAIQTQLNAKEATITGAATTITGANLTSNRAIASNGSGKVVVSATTSTELGFVSGVTSAIQTQLDSKLPVTITSAATGDIIYFNGSAWVNLPRGTNGQALLSTSGSIAWGAATANGIPTGGTTNQVLAKQSNTNFDTDWETLTLTFIPEVTASAAEVNILDGATILTSELNFLSGASANIQGQLNTKLSTALTTDKILKGVAGVATESTDLPTGITIGGAVIYRVGGTDVTLADGGTGASLADPNADNILFWDDSAGQVTWLTLGTNLSITGTTLNAAGSGVSGLTTNRIPYATSSTTLGDDAGLVWDATNDAITIGSTRLHNTGTNNLFIGSSSGNFTTTSTGTNVAVGPSTMSSVSTGASNIAIGFSALNAITTGTTNIAVGKNAMLLYQSGGGANIAIGEGSLSTSVSGVSNVGVGRNTLLLATGNSNVAIGVSSGDAVSTGTNNLLVGTTVGRNVTTGSRNIVIGNNIDAPSATNSDQLTIQNIIFGTGNSGSGTTISSGNIGIAVSSPTARFHLPSGTATANTAPLKFTSGTNLTSPSDGAVEYDGTNYFVTASTTRYTLAKTLTNTASLDFPSTAASSSQDLTITVTGAADGDVVEIGVPNAARFANTIYTGFVSSANTVTVRFSNLDLVTARDPGSVTVRATVFKYT